MCDDPSEWIGRCLFSFRLAIVMMCYIDARSLTQTGLLLREALKFMRSKIGRVARVSISVVSLCNLMVSNSASFLASMDQVDTLDVYASRLCALAVFQKRK